MTVKELIERLKDFPDDTLVFVYDNKWGFFPLEKVLSEEEITVSHPFTELSDEIFENVVVL